MQAFGKGYVPKAQIMMQWLFDPGVCLPRRLNMSRLRLSMQHES